MRRPVWPMTWHASSVTDLPSGPYATLLYSWLACDTRSVRPERQTVSQLHSTTGGRSCQKVTVPLDSAHGRAGGPDGTSSALARAGAADVDGPAASAAGSIRGAGGFVGSGFL